MVLNRPLTGLLLLAGAAGGPYVLFETDAGKAARSGASQVFGVSSDNPPSGQFTDAFGMPSDGSGSGFWNANGTNFPAAGASGNSGTPGNASDPGLAAPIQSLGEVLRFDVSPNWVLQRFSRVSTVLSELQLDGLRVPLVTGTTPSDLAGTLTYYFDRFKRVQRVTVHAVTGDPSRFMAELQSAYQLQQHPSLGGSLYLLTWNGRPASIVFTTPAPVIYADQPYARYNVLIELNQAGLEFGLSTEAQALLDAGRQASRWQ